MRLDNRITLRLATWNARMICFKTGTCSHPLKSYPVNSSPINYMKFSSSLLTLFLLSGVCCTVFAFDDRFASVAEVRQHLQAKDNVQMTHHEGWIIAHDLEEESVWTFTQADHPAHPAVFVRYVERIGAERRLKSWGLCEADDQACAQLAEHFEELLDQQRESMPH